MKSHHKAHIDNLMSLPGPSCWNCLGMPPLEIEPHWRLPPRPLLALTALIPKWEMYLPSHTLQQTTLSTLEIFQRNEMASQYSNSPKHTDSSFIWQLSFECSLFLSVRSIVVNKVLAPMKHPSWCEETSDKQTSRQISETSDGKYSEKN